MTYDLPTSVEVGGDTWEIRSDYRAVLDIMEALSDAELDDQERAFALLTIFYPAFDEMPPECYEEAKERCFWFINGGEAVPEKKSPQLVSWEQDFPRIVAPVSRVLGQDIRSLPYLHWWSFLSAYMEIGDCLFAQIVNIRSKKAKGKTLDKSEQEFYRSNRQIIDIKKQYTEADNDAVALWTGRT